MELTVSDHLNCRAFPRHAWYSSSSPMYRPSICLFFLLACPVLLHAQTASPFEVTGATIAETQAAITRREPHHLPRHRGRSYLARIKAYDQTPLRAQTTSSPLNAIVLINPNALAEADACDRSFAVTHKLLPLSGIAVLIKDNYDTAGLQTTGGSLAMKGFVPEHDAPMIAKLRAAGAIILAKTNMAEWAFSPYLTASSIAGITRNPYDLTRVPAGSSGGTAAAVSASLGESGLGTDTGNSIRGPSSHNDLVGIRPTIGLTSRSGIHSAPVSSRTMMSAAPWRGCTRRRRRSPAHCQSPLPQTPQMIQSCSVARGHPYPHPLPPTTKSHFDRHGLGKAHALASSASTLTTIRNRP